jgi:hypothetical protein
LIRPVRLFRVARANGGISERVDYNGHRSKFGFVGIFACLAGTAYLRLPLRCRKASVPAVRDSCNVRAA